VNLLISWAIISFSRRILFCHFKLRSQTALYRLVLHSMLHLATEPRQNGIPISCLISVTWCSQTEFHKPQFPQTTQGIHNATTYFPSMQERYAFLQFSIMLLAGNPF